jgi:thiol:disulfide interchange protein
MHRYVGTLLVALVGMMQLQCYATPKEIQHSSATAVHHHAHEYKRSFASTMNDYIARNNSLIVQLAAVFLLGLLMSLTPCIYPMIPITIGILQAQGGTSSLIANALQAGAYATGMATTFALLGTFAAYTGTLFGAAMQHPLVILIFCLLLVYLAGSLFGFYELRVPSFNYRPRTTKKKSLLAAFGFGMFSGTVASPCVSPGLIALLAIVSTLRNVFLGFILLFVFGWGLSMPLLIIGTFSQTLSLFPRAGMWMVRIKQAMGVILLCIALWMALNTLSKQYTFLARYVPGAEQKVHWIDNKEEAYKIAQQFKKPLFIKLFTPQCSLCTAIDKKFFCDSKVSSVINNSFVPLKVNALQEQSQDIVKTYHVIGVPLFLIVNGADGSLMERLDGAVYEKSSQELYELLSSLASTKGK